MRGSNSDRKWKKKKKKKKKKEEEEEEEEEVISHDRNQNYDLQQKSGR